MEILNLRAAGMVVGAIGAVAGVAGVANSLARGDPGVAPGPGDAGAITAFGIAALCAYAVGLLGAVLANPQPRLASALMLLGAIGGLAAPNVPATALLALGAALTFAGREEG